MSSLNEKSVQVITDFNKSYARAMILYMDASLDYIAGRCCMINGIFFRGHSLICEAIEKSLKAIYFIKNKKYHSERRHNLLNLKKDLHSSLFLDKYSTLLGFLTDAHKTRYTESKGDFPKAYSSIYTASDHLDEIDCLWMDIFDNLEAPDEIKYRLAFFPSSLVMKITENYSTWLTVRNKTLSSRYNSLVKKCREIMVAES